MDGVDWVSYSGFHKGKIMILARQNSYVETLGELIEVVDEIHFLAIIELKSHFLAIGHS